MEGGGEEDRLLNVRLNRDEAKVESCRVRCQRSDDEIANVKAKS
jgi:hypothetical protein